MRERKGPGGGQFCEYMSTMRLEMRRLISCTGSLVGRCLVSHCYCGELTYTGRRTDKLAGIKQKIDPNNRFRWFAPVVR